VWEEGGRGEDKMCRVELQVRGVPKISAPQVPEISNHEGYLLIWGMPFS